MGTTLIVERPKLHRRGGKRFFVDRNGNEIEKTGKDYIRLEAWSPFNQGDLVTLSRKGEKARVGPKRVILPTGTIMTKITKLNCHHVKWDGFKSTHNIHVSFLKHKTK